MTTAKKWTAEKFKRAKDAILTEARAQQMEDLASLFAELDKPDRSRVPEFNSGTHHYGGAGRTAPAWERAYARLHRQDPELKQWRTPEHDVEARDFLQAISTNDQAMLREIADRDHNRAYRRQWERADLAGGTIASPGTGFGALPVGFANAIEAILARASRLRPFVNVVEGNTFGMKIPVQGTKTVAAVHSEAGDLTSGVTEPTYTSVTPEAKKLGALVKFSNELLADSPLMLMNAVARDIAEAIGTLEDSSILDGTSIGQSIFNDITASATTWTDASASTVSYIANRYYALGSVFRPRATWIVNEAAAEVITSATGTGERQQFTEFNPTPTALDDVPGQTGVLMGRPCLVFPTGTGGVPADEAVFGDLTGYTLYLREQLRAEASRDSDFGTDQTALRVLRRIAGIVTQGDRIQHFG